MVFNITYHSHKTDHQIAQLVGKPYSVLDRLKMGGVGSPRMIINMASEDIAELFGDSPGFKFCNIELRNNGIIVGFQSNMRIFAWAIPYYKLTIYHNKGLISIYSGESHLKIKPFFNKDIDLKFVAKLLELKARYTEDNSPF